MKIQKVFFVLIMGFAVFALSGCATLLSKKQTVIVTSDVKGAAVYKGKKYVGVTPCTFRTKVAKNTITVTKDGTTHTINADVKLRRNAWWNYFNGFIGWSIDGLIGTTQKYGITNYYVSFSNPSVNNTWNFKHPRGWQAAEGARAKAKWEAMTPEEREKKLRKREQILTFLGALGNAAIDGLDAYAQEQAQRQAARNAENEAREARLIEEQRARVEAMKQRTREKDEMEAQRRREANYAAAANMQEQQARAKAQSRNSTPMTSDIDAYNAQRMNAYTGGTSTSNESYYSHNQASNYTQNNSDRMSQYSTTQSTSSPQSNVSGTIVNAVTANGHPILLKVSSGGVVAYSTSNTGPNIRWETIGSGTIPQSISNLDNTDSQEIQTRYGKKTYIPGIGNVYFGNSSQNSRVSVSNNNSETIVDAVTSTGTPVKLKIVTTPVGTGAIAYSTGNVGANMQWQAIGSGTVPQSINSLDNTDPQEIRTRYSRKVNVTGLGTVYF